MIDARRTAPAVALLLVLLSACGSTAASTESAPDTENTESTPSPTELPPSPPTTVPPGPCTAELTAAEPAEPTSTAPASPDDAGGDMPPNHVDNRSWRQRTDLSAEQLAEATVLAEQVRDVLHPLCEQGQFTPDVVRDALQSEIGPSALVMGFESAMGETSTGLVIAVDVDGGGCVTGSSSPGAVHLHAGGPTREGACLEPVSH